MRTSTTPGLLPRLVAEGFSGPDLLRARQPGPGVAGARGLRPAIQEEEARYARKHGYSRHADPQPLYTRQDARAALRLLQPLAFDEEQEIFRGIRVRFRRAGHLLGAASDRGQRQGRRRRAADLVLLRRRRPLRRADPGGSAAAGRAARGGDPRIHLRRSPARPSRSARGPRARAARRSVERGGVAVMPAFALGRTQEVLYHLSALVDARAAGSGGRGDRQSDGDRRHRALPAGRKRARRGDGGAAAPAPRSARLRPLPARAQRRGVQGAQPPRRAAGDRGVERHGRGRPGGPPPAAPARAIRATPSSSSATRPPAPAAARWSTAPTLSAIHGRTVAGARRRSTCCRASPPTPTASELVRWAGRCRRRRSACSSTTARTRRARRSPPRWSRSAGRVRRCRSPGDSVPW